MTTKTQTHTPTPWHIGMKPGPMLYGPQGERVADMTRLFLDDDEARANAAHIVHCVNLHEELVEALEAIADLNSHVSVQHGIITFEDGGYLELNTLIRKAKGGA